MLARLRDAGSSLFPYPPLFRSPGGNQEMGGCDRISWGAPLACVRGQTPGGSHHSASSRMVAPAGSLDRKSTRLNSSHITNSYAVFSSKKITSAGGQRLTCLD